MGEVRGGYPARGRSSNSSCRADEVGVVSESEGEAGVGCFAKEFSHQMGHHQADGVYVEYMKRTSLRFNCLAEIQTPTFSMERGVIAENCFLVREISRQVLKQSGTFPEEYVAGVFRFWRWQHRMVDGRASSLEELVGAEMVNRMVACLASLGQEHGRILFLQSGRGSAARIGECLTSINEEMRMLEAAADEIEGWTRRGGCVRPNWVPNQHPAQSVARS